METAALETEWVNDTDKILKLATHEFSLNNVRKTSLYRVLTFETTITLERKGSRVIFYVFLVLKRVSLL